MRDIGIIGAGQAGLVLAIGLLKKGFNVSLYSQENEEEFLNGKIRSSQGIFNSALAIERKLQLNFWDTLAPKNDTVSFTLADPVTLEKIISWTGKTKDFYQSIDQRLKFSRWLYEFRKLNGQLYIKKVDISNIDNISKQHELTVISTGKSELNKLFEIDRIRSKYLTPQRAMCCIYVKNMLSSPNLGVQANIIPNVGEYFNMPGLTKNGQCTMMLFEGIPKKDFDCWNIEGSPETYLKKAKELLTSFLPWEAERCSNIELTDNNAILAGGYTPIIRKPVSRLKSGKLLLGLGDSIVLNDPIAGQGANTATKASYIYLEQIIDRGQQSFDEEWMYNTFEKAWNQDGKNATKWTNLMLEPPSNHIIELMHKATNNISIANALANGFDDPNTLFPWIEYGNDILI